MHHITSSWTSADRKNVNSVAVCLLTRTVSFLVSYHSTNRKVLYEYLRKKRKVYATVLQ